MPKRPSIKPQHRQEGHGRIRKLKCYEEVYDRICTGWPLPEVAKFIQEVKKECADITRGSLVSALVDFRKTLPPGELTQRVMTKQFVEAIAKVESGMDELVELEKLYRLQMERIGIAYDKEKQIGMLLPTGGQEVRTAREILSTYADLKMDLGLSKRHLGQVDVEGRLLHDVAVKYSNKEEVQQVMSDAQSRKKVLSLVERLMSRQSTALIKDAEFEPIQVREEGSEALALVPKEELPVEGNLLAEDEEDVVETMEDAAIDNKDAG